MLRKFFVDCVAVFALCLVVWGVAPAWAVCLCEESIRTCVTIEEKDDDGKVIAKKCESYHICGSRYI